MYKCQQFARPLVVFVALIVVVAAPTAAQDNRNASPEKEKELLAVLRSDAAAGDKALTCKLLAIHGSAEAVPELAKLLPDPQLSSWARIALEAIPGSEADEVLLKAADSLDGKLLVGMINSIGVRRNANAVDILNGHLQNKDVQVAAAAAVALGRIGGADATSALRSALAIETDTVRSAVAEGCVLCAERLQAEDQSAQAAAIYDEVRHADVPAQRIIEATRGAILARKEVGIPLLLEQFRSPDKKMFQLALSTAREFPGREVDQALADELASATPPKAALMIQAMADRTETVVLASLLKAAEQGPQQVRLSAIDALARVGDDSCLESLLKIALDSDSDLAQAAKATLAKIPADNVDAQFLVLLRKTEGKSYPLLIEIVGRRRIEATDVLLEALNHSDRAVRSAGLTALGETVALKDLPVLIEKVIATTNPDEALVAQRALKAASIRMPDRDRCAAELAHALQRSPDSTKGTILEILGDVGGTRALETIAAAAKSDDPVFQDVGSRLLGKWNSMDAAPVLLDLAETAEKKYQIRALRGYIAIARKFAMSPEQRAEMCQRAFDTAIRPNEQILVLDVLKLYPGAETFRLAQEAMQVPEVKREATEATLVIAQELGGKEINVAQLLSQGGFEKVELEIIQAEYGSGGTVKDVTGVIRKHAADLPFITLPSPGYNSSFGGDPLPGYVKQLKIQYRINGKEGEASFAENALIILPLPK